MFLPSTKLTLCSLITTIFYRCLKAPLSSNKSIVVCLIITICVKKHLDIFETYKITSVHIYMSVSRHYDIAVYMRWHAASFNFVLSIKLLGCFLINRRYKLKLFFIIKIILAEPKVQ